MRISKPKIYQLTQERNMQLADVAAKIGMSRTSLSKALSRGTMNETYVVRLAKLFDVTPGVIATLADGESADAMASPSVLALQGKLDKALYREEELKEEVKRLKTEYDRMLNILESVVKKK